MLGKILIVAGGVKKIHTHLYKNNEQYQQTVDRTVSDAVGGSEFARRCAADWWLWRTTGVEDGGATPTATDLCSGWPSTLEGLPVCRSHIVRSRRFV